MTKPAALDFYTLTVEDNNGLHTSVWLTEEAALDSLIVNYAPDCGQTRETIVDELTENQGIVPYLAPQTLPLLP